GPPNARGALAGARLANPFAVLGVLTAEGRIAHRAAAAGVRLPVAVGVRAVAGIGRPRLDARIGVVAIVGWQRVDGAVDPAVRRTATRARRRCRARRRALRVRRVELIPIAIPVGVIGPDPLADGAGFVDRVVAVVVLAVAALRLVRVLLCVPVVAVVERARRRVPEPLARAGRPRGRGRLTAGLDRDDVTHRRVVVTVGVADEGRLVDDVGVLDTGDAVAVVVRSVTG